jgi:DNA-binding transcriptional regulator LsrR (DeoR family)
MSYKLFEVMDIYNIITRWHAGYKIRQISKTLQMDRKTVRTYIKLAEKAGLVQDQPLPETVFSGIGVLDQWIVGVLD